MIIPSSPPVFSSVVLTAVTSPPPLAPAGTSTAAAGSSSNEQRAIVLVRVVDTAVPPVLLAALDAEAKKREALAAVAAATTLAAAGNRGAPIKLMRRSPGEGRSPNLHQGQRNGGAEKQVKSVEDWERKYAEVRARIFGTKSPSVNSPTSASQPGCPSPHSVAPTPIIGSIGTAVSAATGEGTAEAGSPETVVGKEVQAGLGDGQGVTAGDEVVKNKDGEADDVPETVAVTVNGGKNGSAVAKGTVPEAVKEMGNKGTKDENVDGNVHHSSEIVNCTPAVSARTPTVSRTAATVVSANTTSSSAAGKKTEREAKQAGGVTTSQGPDGTPGFGRGRGKPLPSAGRGGGERSAGGENIGRGQGSEGSDRGSGEAGRGTAGVGGRGSAGGGRGTGGRGNRKAPVNAGEWKGQRGMQRNRMAEKSDPDFVRNYDNYRPNFPPYRQLADPGGGYGVGGGRGAPTHGNNQQQQHPRLLHPNQVGGFCFGENSGLCSGAIS